MPISEWYPVRNMEAGIKAKWRVEYDELVTRMRVVSNGSAACGCVAAGRAIDVYRGIARRIAIDLNKRH